MEPARRAVEMWRDRLAAAARNLADLNGSEDVRRLRARLAGENAFEGATLAAARRVAAALDGLWADYLLVSRTVEEAAVLARRPLFGPARDGEAAALLDGASIRLPAVAVPLGGRGLLDAAERSAATTPAAVLDAMVEGFEGARRGAAAIAAAATAGRVKLDALRAEPAAAEPPLAARLAAASRALDRDPLAAADLLAPLAAALAARRAEAEAAGRRRAALADGLARARADLAALRDALRRRDGARRDAAGLLEFAPPAPDGDDDLAAWLDTLAAAGAAGRGDAALVGLERWSEGCAKTRRAADAEAESVAARLRERDDLRGRFRALRAKAAVLAAREPADPEPPALVAALDAKPFDAARARALLSAWEAELTARRRPS